MLCTYSTVSTDWSIGIALVAVNDYHTQSADCGGLGKVHGTSSAMGVSLEML